MSSSDPFSPRARSTPGLAITLAYASSLGRHRFRQWMAGNHVPEPWVPPKRDPAWVLRLPRAAFDEGKARLFPGRFYPASLLRRHLAWPSSVFRVRECSADEMLLDFNHPLAGLEVQQSLETSIQWNRALGKVDDALRWAGMETALETPTEFDDEDAYRRADEAEDVVFYRSPRPVLHVDATCAAAIRRFYTARLKPGARVLDLMSGWRSHLPSGLGLVTGLGMNGWELRANPELTDHLVQDLNCKPKLPFAGASYDAAVTTVSFEYLVRPLEVLAELRRVLRPGGSLMITLSTRSFPTKAIRLWERLHPMERLGWLLQCLQRSGFIEIESLVERGLARDREDRYAPRLPEMDPLFAAAGYAP